MHAGIEGPHSDWSPLWCPPPPKTPLPGRVAIKYGWVRVGSDSSESGSASGRGRAGGYFSFSAKPFGHSPHMTIIATIYSLPLPG